MSFILPSLFDRLTERAPPEQWQAEEMLAKKVQRDLEALLNTKTLESIEGNISNYSEAQHSVVNYGITDYAGLLRNELNIQSAMRLIEQAILAFEPRIIARTLEIIPDSLLQGNEKNFSDLPVDIKNKLFEKGAFEFTIRGQICASERPINFECNTNMSFLTGNVSVK